MAFDRRLLPGHSVQTAARCDDASPQRTTTMLADAEPLYDRDDWWRPGARAFASLRSVARTGLRLLDEWIGTDWYGRTVVDLGCGGGLLSVPLARRGASVLGVDLAHGALLAARREEPDGWLAVAGDLADPPVAPGCTDVVLLSDVIEHVDDPALVMRQAAALLRPGGRLFVNTIARTWRSRWLAIRLGEGFGFVPRGTHRWERFINPDELDAMARAAGLRRVAARGHAPRIFATLWKRAIVLRRSRSLAVAYAMLFSKDPDG